MAAIAVFLIWKAIPAFTDNTGNLFTTQTWNPQGDPPVFGMAAVFFGTVVAAFIAMIVGVPIAIGVALFISHYAQPPGGHRAGRDWSTCSPRCRRWCSACGVCTS